MLLLRSNKMLNTMVFITVEKNIIKILALSLKPIRDVIVKIDSLIFCAP